MGNCCSGDTKQNIERDLFRGKNDFDLRGIPIQLVLKVQALVRGFLARRRIEKIYGFVASPGLLRRGFDYDPEKLEEQRIRVQRIREELPAFQYGIMDGEDYEPGVSKEHRDMIILQDGS
jgi:hypothetical protein